MGSRWFGLTCLELCFIYVFGITFVLVARAGAANLLLPLNSQLLWWKQSIFHLLVIILVICPIVLALSSDYPNSARASFSLRELISSFPSCPVYLSCHTWGWCISDWGEKAQTCIHLGETPHPRLSFIVPKFGKSLLISRSKGKEEKLQGKKSHRTDLQGWVCTARKPSLFFCKSISLWTLVIPACEKAVSPSWGCFLSYSW